MRILSFLWIRFCTTILIFTSYVSAYENYRHWFGFGLFAGGQYYSYNEPQVMSIDGVMYGLSGYISATHYIFKHQLYGGFFSGITRYSGSECSVANPLSCRALQSASQDFYYNIEYRVSARIFEDSKKFMYGGLGLGFRDLHNSVVASSGYDRVQNYLYMLLFVGGEYSLQTHTNLFAHLTYRQLIRGHNVSYFRDLGFDNNLSFTQQYGYGIRAEVGAKRDLQEYGYIGVIALGLYVDYWYIGDSDTDSAYTNGNFMGVYYEPHNNTKALGIYVGYEF